MDEVVLCKKSFFKADPVCLLPRMAPLLWNSVQPCVLLGQCLGPWLKLTLPLISQLYFLLFKFPPQSLSLELRKLRKCQACEVLSLFSLSLHFLPPFLLVFFFFFSCFLVPQIREVVLGWEVTLCSSSLTGYNDRLKCDGVNTISSPLILYAFCSYYSWERVLKNWLHSRETQLATDVIVGWSMGQHCGRTSAGLERNLENTVATCHFAEKKLRPRVWVTYLSHAAVIGSFLPRTRDSDSL